MNEENYYLTIRGILQERLQAPYNREEIKSKITEAVGGDNYIEAITAYLWGAYINFDPEAKPAFREIFINELRMHNPAAFEFFSFYFQHDLKRTGFDRRCNGDRRESYSLDFFSNKAVDRRQGGERRQDTEKRLNWTRISRWASVPFKTEDSCAGDDYAGGDKLNRSNGRQGKKTPLPFEPEMDVRSINAILSALVRYFESHVKNGQTAWRDSLDEDLFQSAKDVMQYLDKIKAGPA